jgi:quercetin dioxygenase-like cupin family protein
MRLKGIVAVVVGLFFLVGGAATAQYSGPGIAPAQAQDGKPAQPKGVTSRGLVGSAGAIASISATAPVALSGRVVELAPGGQTGKQRNLVPSFLYVLDGTLVIDTQGGGTGDSGVQYHGEGQAYSGPVGLWHNVMNTSQQPARYLMLFVAAPGAKTVEQASDEE